MGQADHSGHQAGGDIGLAQGLAVFRGDLHRVAVSDAARLGVLLCEEDGVRAGLAQPGDIVEDGVGTALVVRVDALERILALLAAELAVHEGLLVALGRDAVLRDGAVLLLGIALGVEDIGPGLAGKLDLAGGGGDGMALGIVAELLLVDEAEVVADVAVDAVEAVLHILGDGDAALLRLALDAPLLDIVLGIRHDAVLSAVAENQFLQPV